jgi:hypothetical protein
MPRPAAPKLSEPLKDKVAPADSDSGAANVTDASVPPLAVSPAPSAEVMAPPVIEPPVVMFGG